MHQESAALHSAQYCSCLTFTRHFGPAVDRVRIRLATSILNYRLTQMHGSIHDARVELQLNANCPPPLIAC